MGQNPLLGSWVRGFVGSSVRRFVGSWVRRSWLEADRRVGERAEDAAYYRRRDGNPAVVPIRVAFAGDWEHSVGNAGAEVACRVDGVPGGSAERQSDPKDQDPHQERLKRAAEDLGQVNLAGLRPTLGVCADRED